MTDHISPDRLGVASPTSTEAAHLAICVRCRVEALRFRDFDEVEAVTASSTLGAPFQPQIAGGGGTDRFSALRSLGAGGVARVDLAYDGLLHREVARKVLRAGSNAGSEVDRFVREAQITAQLEHPNIVPVYDLGRDERGEPVLTMRVVRGTSLAVAIASGALPSGRPRMEVFLKICDAVGFAHSHGVVHRDVKPENVMVGPFGDVQVLDFGLAAHADARAVGRQEAPDGSGHLTQIGSVMGTPVYMAPEQARGETHRVGPHSDVYSLGATLWYILTGSPPFEGDVTSVLAQVAAGLVRSPRVAAPTVSADLEAVVMRAMAPEPADRYPTVTMLRADVAAFLDDRPVSARRTPPLERLAKWGTRHRSALVPVVATVGIGVATVLALLVGWLHEARTTQAEARLAQALSELADDPEAARSALVEARSLGSAGQRLSANLALDAIAEAAPVPATTLVAAGKVRRLSVSPTGREAATVTEEGEVRRFLLPEGRQTGRWTREAGVEAVGAGWLSDGRFVRLIHRGRQIHLLAEDGAEVAMIDSGVGDGSPRPTGDLVVLADDRIGVGVYVGERAMFRVYTSDGRLDRTVTNVIPWDTGNAYVVGDPGEYALVDAADRSLWSAPNFETVIALHGDLAVALVNGRRLEARSIPDGALRWDVDSGWTDHAGVAMGDTLAMMSAAPGGEHVDIRRISDGVLITRLGAEALGRDLAWDAPLRLLLVPSGSAVRVTPVGDASAWSVRSREEGGLPVAISPDGGMVADVSGNHALEVRSRASRQVLREFPLGRIYPTKAVRFIDGRRLAVACDREVIVFDLVTGSESRIQTPDRTTAIVATPTGLLAASKDGSVMRVDDDGTISAHALHPGPIWDAELVDGVLITSGRDPLDHTIRAWRWPGLEPMWTHDTGEVPYQVDAKRNSVVYGTDEGNVGELDVRTGRLRWSTSASPRAVMGVALDDDGTVFTTGIDGAVSAFAANGEHAWTWPASNVGGFQISALHGLVVASFEDGGTWWLERGLHDRVTSTDQAAVGRRYLAARAPALAARWLALAPSGALRLHERLLLIEERVAPLSGLHSLPLSRGSADAWVHLLSSDPPTPPSSTADEQAEQR